VIGLGRSSVFDPPQPDLIFTTNALKPSLLITDPNATNAFGFYRITTP